MSVYAAELARADRLQDECDQLHRQVEVLRVRLAHAQQERDAARSIAVRLEQELAEWAEFGEFAGDGPDGTCNDPRCTQCHGPQIDNVAVRERLL